MGTLHGKDLVVARGRNDQLTFEVTPKATVRGRSVIDATTGKPVADTSIWGKSERAPRRRRQDVDRMDDTDWGQTDEKGEYTLRLAAGPARVSCHKQDFAADVDPLPFVVGKESAGKIPELHIHPIPKVRGIVLGPDGRPAPNTIVPLFAANTCAGSCRPSRTRRDASS